MVAQTKSYQNMKFEIRGQIIDCPSVEEALKYEQDLALRENNRQPGSAFPIGEVTDETGITHYASWHSGPKIIQEKACLFLIAKKIPFIVTGSYASYLRGEIKKYNDIDIIVFGDGAYQLAQEGWIPEPTVQQYPHFLWAGLHHFTHLTGKSVDLLVAEEAPFMEFSETCSQRQPLVWLTTKEQQETYSLIEAGKSEKKSWEKGFGEFQKEEKKMVYLNEKGQMPYAFFGTMKAVIKWEQPFNYRDMPSAEWQKWAAEQCGVEVTLTEFFPTYKVITRVESEYNEAYVDGYKVELQDFHYNRRLAEMRKLLERFSFEYFLGVVREETEKRGFYSLRIIFHHGLTTLSDDNNTLVIKVDPNKHWGENLKELLSVEQVEEGLRFRNSLLSKGNKIIEWFL